MKTSRSSRILTVFVAIFSMLFMQLAVASYVCPGMPASSEGQAASASVGAADMPNCEGMDTAQSTLCHLHAHGEPAKQSLDKNQVPDVPPFVPVMLVLDLPIFDVVAVFDSKPYLPIALTRTAAPPIAIRNCCFRI
jgi:hypothetical protein